MSKNVWLKRAEAKKLKELEDAGCTVIVNCCTRSNIQVSPDSPLASPDPVMAEHAVKFKGKFQEADKVNKQGRIYPSKVLEESIRKIAEEGKREIPGHNDPLHERWHAPTTDEDIWVPIRPTAEAVKLNQDSLNQVSAHANEFHDLSAIKGSNSRYKEYDRLRLMEDAMIVYNVGRSEPRNISVMSSGDYPAGLTGPVGDPGPQGVAGIPGEQEDIAYFKNKLLTALKMPKEVSKKLASEDVHFARKYERETGESLCEWREISSKELIERNKLQRLEELKIEVMGQNPQILGVSANQGFQSFNQSVTISGPQYSYHSNMQPPTAIRFEPEQITNLVIGDERRVFSVDVEPQDSEKFIDKLKEMFKKKAREDKRLKNIEAQAGESQTWFSPNGPNRGNIPNIIDVFAEVAAEAYTQLTAKIDHMCNESFLYTPVGAGSITITTPPANLMADSMIGDGIVVAGTLTLSDPVIKSKYNISIGGC